MQDLEARVLQAAVVSSLTGLSRRTLTRWESVGIPPGRRAGSGYSWVDVEALQRAAHLVRRRRVPLADIKELLSRGPSGTGAAASVVIARPRPQTRRRRVVSVPLPRSARRKRQG